MQFDNDLHDWHLDGVLLGVNDLTLYVRSYRDAPETRKIIKLTGVRRCIMDDFFVQNIIYEAKILNGADDGELFKQEIERLNGRYPARSGDLTYQILRITSSVGAEMTVEFTDLQAAELVRRAKSVGSTAKGSCA